jgi:hypothetical protein
MKALYKKKHRKELVLEGFSYDDRSQAVMLYKGVPILSKVNKEDVGILTTLNISIKIMRFLR